MTKRNLAKEYVLNYKRSHHCIKCNEKRMTHLTFHHSDPTKKKISIGKAVYIGLPLYKIIQELKKCVVMCNECHDKLHGN